MPGRKSLVIKLRVKVTKKGDLVDSYNVLGTPNRAVWVQAVEFLGMAIVNSYEQCLSSTKEYNGVWQKNARSGLSSH